MTGHLLQYFGKVTSVNPEVPRQLVTGLVARNTTAARTPAMRVLIAGTVLETNWSDLAPSSANLSSTELQRLNDELDWAQGEDLPVRLRLYAGYNSPAWLISAVGGLDWYSNDGTEATGPAAPSDPTWNMLPSQIPQWWQQDFLDAYADMQTALAAAIGNHPALAEVCLSEPCTQYSEPMIKEFTLLENRQAAQTAGYTSALDIAAFHAAADAHNTAWAPHRIATNLACNPWQTINTSNGNLKTDVTTTTALMDYQVSATGRMTVIANNSLQNPEDQRGATYTTMYEYMKTGRSQTDPFPWPIAFQTSTLAKMKNAYNSTGQPSSGICTPFATCQMAQSWGATSVELPSGCEDDPDPTFLITPSQAATLNQQMATASADLLS